MVPGTVAFGADDPYLNPELAQHPAAQFANAELRLIEHAGHCPQWDQPQAVAQTITTAIAQPQR